MKKIILLLLSIMAVLTYSLSGQNNLDFETWIVNPQGIEQPEFWRTNSIQNFVCVFKSTNSSSGNFSALIKSNGISFEGKAPGILQTNWYSLNKPLQNISYNLKIDSLTNNAEAKVSITGFVSGNVLFNHTATYTVVTSGWINETLILSDTSAICDSIQVIFMASTTATPTGYIGYSEVLVDDIQFNQPLNTNELDVLDKYIRVYPNPANDILLIEVTKEIQIENIGLFDVGGKKVKTYNISDRNMNISDLGIGVYFLKLSTPDGEITKKVIIE